MPGGSVLGWPMLIRLMPFQRGLTRQGLLLWPERLWPELLWPEPLWPKLLWRKFLWPGHPPPEPEQLDP